jgi:hypothetical protein
MFCLPVKKNLLLAAMAAVTLTACKKEYACTCTTENTTYTNGVALASGPVTDDVQIGKMMKREARKKCESMNGIISSGDTQYGVKSEISCRLK